MRPAVLIHSCSHDIKNGRHAAINETWGPEVRKYADLYFFVGRENTLPLADNEVQLDATEDKDNLVDKEAAMLHWAVERGYERMLKTETDVYINARRMFYKDYTYADVIGRYVGQWGNFYGSSNLYSFIQGHACWYSAKAAKIVAVNIRATHDAAHRGFLTWEVGKLDPSLRAADLWSAQVLTPYWQKKMVTVENENDFAYGPSTWHLIENKADTPNWIRKMHREHNGT